jgi:GxxExxY protein
MPLIGEELTRGAIGAFYEVYNALGHGFLEAVYANALEISLRERGFVVEREAATAVGFHGQAVGAYRIDLLVNDRLIVEVKAARHLDASAEKQLLNYLRSTRLELGLLMHFGPRPFFRRLVSTNKEGLFLRDAVPPR